MNRRLNNKGMSLLELIISMTISVIIVLMIIAYISGAFRIFKRTNDDVNLQLEAQTAINQLSNVIMEAKDVTDIITIDPANEIRYGIESLDLTGFSDYAIIYRKASKKLFLVELTPEQSVYFLNFNEELYTKNYLLAEYVTDFTITEEDTDSMDDVSVKKINMTMELGDDSYEIEKKVRLRNYKNP